MGELFELQVDLFQKLFDVNIKGFWYLASRMVLRMAEHGGGLVINVISVAGLKLLALVGFYAVIKAVLDVLTKVMAAEWAGKGIRVNSLVLGSYHFDLFDSAVNILGYMDGAINACLQKWVVVIDEIIGLVLYLVSDLLSYIMGYTLVSDGGYMVF